ncbi:MAG TPA: DUF1801 domain-containing protein [Thermoplasmata archaeon]|nr:DUF1801 domain-containing protein [Thermoplasmata archaeon]
MTPAEKGGKKPGHKGFTAEEKAAAKETVRERQVDWGRLTSVEAERLVVAKIAEFPEPDRSLAKRIHGIIRGNAPHLKPRLWYGMPAYSKDGEVVCFFQNASKFKVRYSTLGFSDEAKLDDGRMWPVTYAVVELTPAEEAKIGALVRKAVG